jgi:hypothetical protein
MFLEHNYTHNLDLPLVKLLFSSNNPSLAWKLPLFSTPEFAQWLYKHVTFFLTAAPLTDNHLFVSSYSYTSKDLGSLYQAMQQFLFPSPSNSMPPPSVTGTSCPLIFIFNVFISTYIPF